MKETNVAFINDQHVFSGVFTYTYKIFENLQNHGLRCEFYQFLIDSNVQNLPAHLKIREGYFSKFNGNTKFVYDLKLAVNFLSGRNWKQFKNVSAEVVILSYPTLLPLARYLKKKIVEGHDLYFKYPENKSGILGAYMRRMYNLYRNADHIIANSEFTKGEFKRELGISNEKISVVYPAVDETVFHPGKNDLKSKLNINNDSTLLLSVGGDGRNKNIETIIKLMKTLPENFLLLRVGRNFNTMKLIDSLGLSRRIIILGNVDQSLLSELYRGSDIFLFPSTFEGFGIPVIEAMASGLPVITSNSASLPEVVGDAGIMCDPFDIECWKNSVESIANDEAIRIRLREMGIRRSKFFSTERQFTSLMAAIETVERK
ncbi:MAG: glycosyltransferase family 1 protein [Candidatus Micrarchaeia archaeon]